jgi:hypothetical protein
MAYVLPTFNLSVSIWTNATYPGPARLVTVGNLAWGRRVNVASMSTIGAEQGLTLLLPKLTDVRSSNMPSGPDLVECPTGSGRFYEVAFVDDIGKGFSNEHRAAVLAQLVPMPQPLT